MGRAVFLDCDGTIIEDVGYPYDKEIASMPGHIATGLYEAVSWLVGSTH